MRLLLLYISALASLSFAASSPAVAEPLLPPAFFSSIPDLPLMPGLREMTDQVSIFDKPEGRIIETPALIESGARDTIEHYYDRVLLEFGWQRIGKNAFVREGERLHMAYEVHNGQEFIRFMLTPR
jgi:hypothetical protein